VSIAMQQGPFRHGRIDLIEYGIIQYIQRFRQYEDQGINATHQ
jgi:hypothetical protein